LKRGWTQYWGSGRPGHNGNTFSQGSSPEGEQQLELFYYAVDLVGPEVPQVMAVFCTAKKDGKLGNKVEITLAAAL